MKKFAILGCGMIAGFHADALEGVEGACLKGVADISYENAESFAVKRGIAAYKSYDGLLADEEVDAVCICTPNGFHAQNAIAALESGKHVVLEKPMAINPEDADKIIDACKKYNRCLTVISQLRFSEDIARAKRIMSEGKLGQLLSADLYMKYWREASYYSAGGWKGTLSADGGGALMNQGIHGVDILQYLAGVPRVLSAATRTLFHKIEAEDIAVAALEFENGALGVIQASTCLKPGFDRRIELVGTKGYMKIVENKITELITEDNTLEVSGSDNVEKCNSASDPGDFPIELHRRQLENFVAAIDNREPLLIDAEEGRKAVKIICDIYRKSSQKEEK